MDMTINDLRCTQDIENAAAYFVLVSVESSAVKLCFFVNRLDMAYPS